MSGAGYTPGPWRIDAKHDDTRVEIVGRPTWGCTRYGIKSEWGVATIDLDDSEDAQANAHLIAAAPALYEALSALMEIEDADKDMEDFADDESVGAYQDQEDGSIKDLPLTFGHIRRARQALALARPSMDSLDAE